MVPLKEMYIMLTSKNIEHKIPDISNLSTNSTLNIKINVVKNDIPSIANLAITAALNAKINELKSKIPNIINLVTTTTTTTTTTALSHKN